ncbi:MAG: hypothetical protein KatS3mg078_0437 [Deltaproteobacteria bacterium]|jgi:hypothetical protein|nr:hypothetical protein HRbin37_00506 [bacterium HR37]GIW46560.1 MAG: hypothetical protein KatS3mg078_0437 [Deltaproteobacteria bacterium]
MEEYDYNLERFTQLVVAILAIGVLGFILTVAAVALFGPHIQDYLKGLPWGVG